MPKARTSAALAGVALAALLGGCSGALKSFPSQSSGWATGQTANRFPIRASQAHPVVGLFASDALNRDFATRAISPRGRPFRLGGFPFRCAHAVHLVTSELKTGDLAWFCEDNPNDVGVDPGSAGWGLAVQPVAIGSQMAVGANGGTIGIWSASGGQSSVLTLSGMSAGYNALGICWDDAGGLYATNWPGNGMNGVIDYWNAVQVGAGGAPTNSITLTTVTEPYYLACDFDPAETGNNGYLMVYGFALGTPRIDSDIARVMLPSGPDVVVQELGNKRQKTGFPGGLALNKTDHLVANDRYGILYDLGSKAPWNARKPPAACTWGYNPNEFTNVVFDDTQKEVWVSDVNFAMPKKPITYAQSEVYPFPTSGACVTPGESGGPTRQFDTSEQEELGVAVSRNTGY